MAAASSASSRQRIFDYMVIVLFSRASSSLSFVLSFSSAFPRRFTWPSSVSRSRT